MNGWEPYGLTLFDQGQPTVTVVGPTPEGAMKLLDEYIRHMSMLAALEAIPTLEVEPK